MDCTSCTNLGIPPALLKRLKPLPWSVDEARQIWLGIPPALLKRLKLDKGHTKVFNAFLEYPPRC